MKNNLWAVPCIGMLALGLSACSRVSPESVLTANSPDGASPAASAAPAPAPTISVPAGTRIRVRLLDTLDTRRNRAGDPFTATLDEPLVDGDRVVVPTGTIFRGHIVAAKASGRFKGRAVMTLRLDAFDLNGQVYPLQSSETARFSKGHKKHNLLWIGGGSGGGAMIGALAAAGPGALIGAGAGAAAGTVGSAITGKRNISLPVESTVTFSLRSAVEIRG
jgi:hypothetical protein